MLQWHFFFVIFFTEFRTASCESEYISLSTELLSNSDRSGHAHNDNSKLMSLPFDCRLSIVGYLNRKNMHSFIRSCKENSLLCKEYIHRLICSKFDYLLKHDCCTIDIQHLLNTPLVDSICMNASDMVTYFQSKKRNKSSTSSKYMGIDRNTSNAFLSFWMKEVNVHHPESDIITIVFNASNIHFVHFAEPFARVNSIQVYIYGSEYMDVKTLTLIKGVSSILKAGKLRDEAPDNHMWCLIDQLESCMVWPRFKESLMQTIHPNTTLSIVYCLVIVLVLWAVFIIIFTFWYSV